MQTFLPYTSYQLSAVCLDNKRLGKQRVEAWQIFCANICGPRNPVTGKSTAWYHHPAVKMWRDYEYHLCLYGIEMCKEWKRRGFRDSMLIRFETDLERMPKTNLKIYRIGVNTSPPPWLQDVQISHRSQLLMKDYNFYKQYKWDVPLNIPYFWPKG